MFRKKREPEVREPLEIPPLKTWRVEQTDGNRSIEAHEYSRDDRYVTFHRLIQSNWKLWEYLGWSHTWTREVVCELNHDYILSIEESI